MGAHSVLMACTILGDFRDMLCITIALHSNTILSDKNIAVNVSCFNTLLAMNFVAYLPGPCINKNTYFHYTNNLPVIFVSFLFLFIWTI